MKQNDSAKLLSHFFLGKGLSACCSLFQKSWYPEPGMLVSSVKNYKPNSERQALPLILDIFASHSGWLNQSNYYDSEANLIDLDKIIKQDSTYFVAAIHIEKKFNFQLIRYVTSGTITLLNNQTGSHLKYVWDNSSRVGLIGFIGILEKI